MMKFIWTYSIIFSFFFCYSQDTDYKRGKGILGTNVFSYGIGFGKITKKGEYKLAANFSEIFIGRDIYLGSSNSNKHYILTTGISISSFSGNYYSGDINYVDNVFLEIPILLNTEFDYGDLAIKSSIGLYASTLFRQTSEKLNTEKSEYFLGYNFGFMVHLIGFSYKFYDTRAIKVNMPIKGDFAQAYYKGSKVTVDYSISIRLGMEF